jgi:DNA-binding NarL/FixJ family response regulator
MHGDHFTTIASTAGLTVYQVSIIARRLGIPTTTEFRRRRVLKLHRHGLSAPEVAERLGLTVRAVNILRQDLWLPPFPRIQRPVRHRSKIGAEVAALVEAGHSLRVKDIAKTLGVSRQTVYACIKKRCAA